MSTSVIKEYLMRLGFQVNEQQFRQFERSFAEAGNRTKLFSNTTVTSMAAATVAVVSFITTANIGIMQYMNNVAKADMDTELFARRMWIRKDQAKAIMEAQKATGRSLEDVWFSPELRAQFQELQRTAQSVKPPEGFDKQMKMVRSIQLEWMKLRVIAAYAMQHVAYYLTKYLAGPLERIRKTLQGWQTYIKANLPQISSQIAKYLSWFVRIFESMLWVVASVGKAILGLPEHFKMAGIAIGAVFALIMSGPMGLFVAGLSIMLLLLEDFYTFSQGGKSAFPEMWKWVTTTFGEGSKTADGMASSLEWLNWQIMRFRNYLLEIYEEFQKHNVFEHIGDAINAEIGLVKAMAKALGDILNNLKGIMGLGDVDFGKFFDPSTIFGDDGSKPGAVIAQGSNVIWDTIKNWSESLKGIVEGKSPISQETRRPNVINQNVQTVNNVYGNDAYSIGGQLARQFMDTSVLMRDMQGVYR